jgi:hypothetical protein
MIPSLPDVTLISRGTKWLLLSRPRPTEDLMGTMINPFPHDPDCSAIWTMLVERDVDAFLARDWAMVEDDFIAEGFFERHARFKPRPDDWIRRFQSSHVIATNGCDRPMRRRKSLMPSLCARRSFARLT